MQYGLEEIKRLKVCPILHQKKWDYMTPHILNDSIFNYGIRELFKWHARRGTSIPYEVLSSSMSSQYFLKGGKDHDYFFNIQEAFRKFIDKGFYSKIKQPVFNHEIMVDIGKGNVIKYEIPLLTFHRDIMYCVYHDRDPEDFHLSLEAQLIVVWAFYSLGQYPRFLFFDYKDKEVRDKTIRFDMEYIKESKRNLIKISKGLQTPSAYPDRDICINCERKKECPRRMAKWLKE